jgi:hypothetical protein
MLSAPVAVLLLAQFIQVAPPPGPGQPPASTVRVSGTAIREDGQPPQGQLRLLGSGGTYLVNVGADGSFQFPRIPAGSYQLSGGPALATVAIEPIMVIVSDKEISGLRYVVPRVSTAGTPRVATTVEGGGPRPSYQLTFIKVGAPAGTLPFSPPETGALSLNAGDYRVAAKNLPAGYSLKSLTSGSTNLLEQPLKIGVGETPQVRVMLSLNLDFAGIKPVSVSGRINGLKSATNARVMLIAPVIDVPLAAPVNPDGTFSFPRVFPGQYQAEFVFNGAQIQAGVNVGNTNKSDVVLNYTRRFMLTGQVVMEGLPLNTTPVPVTVEVRRTDGVGTPVTSRSTSVGVLRIMVTDGEMSFAVRNVPEGYQVKTFTYGDQDILNNPLKLDDPPIWTFVLKIARK